MEYILIIFMVLILFFFQIWCVANTVKDLMELEQLFKEFEEEFEELVEDIDCLNETVNALISEVG